MVTFENCIFDSCDAETNSAKGGAGFVGARHGYQGQPTQVAFRSCLFSYNRSRDGGALAAQTGGEMFLDQCTLVENVADIGGGISLAFDSEAAITGSTFCGNWCRFAAMGGSLYCTAGTELLDVTLQNTIVAYSPRGAGIACYDGGGLHLTLSCCDVYGNSGGDWAGYIADHRGIDGNFWGNPGFCDTLNGNFTLQASSPCMPDDLLGCGLIGAHGGGCSGDTLVVDPEGGGDYPTIQAALGACSPWDVVELEDGVYTDTANRDVAVPAMALTIRSRGGDPSACLIDCQGTPLSPHRAFSFSHEENQEEIGQESMLRGIGMTGGGFGAQPGGGAIYCWESSPRIAGCLLYRNDGGAAGGALLCEDSSPALIRCTLSGNEASDGGGVYCIGSGRPALQASIISFSGSGEAVYCEGSATPVLSCCCVYGNAGGDWADCIEGQGTVRLNFGVDPCFCAEGEDDYLLHSDSPCAGGWFDCGVIGAMPSGCGIAWCEWPPGAGIDSNALGVAPQGMFLDVVPNPWVTGSRLRFVVPGSTGSAEVDLMVHDAGGRLTRSLIEGPLDVGDQWVLWDGTDRLGRLVPTGVYFCRLRAGGQTAVRPLLVVR